MNNLNQKISQITSNMLSDLTDEQILYLKFCTGFGLKPQMLDTIVTKQKDSYKIKGFIWKYQFVNFKNNGSFLDNQLLIHLRFFKEQKQIIDQESISGSIPSLVTISGNAAYLSGINIGYPTIQYSSGGLANIYANQLSSSCTGYTTSYISDRLLTQQNLYQILTHKTNSLMQDKTSDDVYISLKQFCKKFKSQKFQINEIIQDKKLKIIVV